MNPKAHLISWVGCMTLLLYVTGVLAQEAGPQNPQVGLGTAFTYQGQLKNASGPVTGTCDFQFTLWNALTAGTQTGGTSAATGVSVTKGLFTVQLNSGGEFGATAFAGLARWLQIAVKCSGDGTYTTLSPRQALTAAPYALYSANTDLLDGQHAAAFQQHAQNVLVVAKTGGDYTTITSALNSITTNSSANPFLIYVAPGVYTETVTMKPYVDIEGAGEQATKILTSNSTITSTVTGADNAELRFLTVENTGGGAYNTTVAIFNHNASPRITHVTATATNLSSGVNVYGIYNSNSSPAMMNVNVYAAASLPYNNTVCGVHNDHSSPAMTNVTAIGARGSSVCGVENISSSPVMMNVTAKASTRIGENYEAPDTSAYGVVNDTSSPAMTNVTAMASGGDKDYGVYNSNSSPVMTSVTATASGDEYPSNGKSYGVYNSSASPMMTNVTANASGGSGYSNYGVYNSTSSPTMTGVTASASGGTNNYGVWNASSSPTIQNSVISASGGTINDGVHSIAASGSFTVTINGSQVTGSPSTIYQESYFTTKVGASQLAGGGAFGGIYVCAASYNGNYTALNASCQ